MRKIVVTGATSMLGLATISAALKDDEDILIYAVVRRGSANLSRLPVDNRVFVIECDLGEYDKLPFLIDCSCDTLYHFAWEASSMQEKNNRYFDVDVGYRNIGYALQAYSVACDLECDNFVGAGSQAEYGNLRQDIQTPEDNTSPITCYGIAKDTVRRLLMVKSTQKNVKVQWIRIFSVYGTNDRPNTLISLMIDKMKRDEDILLTKCVQQWDYLYESDAGEAIYLIGKEVKKSEVYCLGSGQGRILKDYVESVKSITKSNSKLLYGVVPYGKDSVMNLNADITKIKKDTSWGGPRVAFEDGICKICENII